jgi:hypothetical protein
LIAQDEDPGASLMSQELVDLLARALEKGLNSLVQGLHKSGA